MTKVTDELGALLPELQLWNGGRGISPADWLFIEPRMDLPVAYSELFWPRFVEFGPYVLRNGFDRKTLKSWEKADQPRQGIEGVMNTIDLLALLVPVGGDCSTLAEKQAVYLGRVLSEIHRVKLAKDFPGRQFVVEFWDGTEETNDDISLSFWQAE
jgi:hypothetical protein